MNAVAKIQAEARVEPTIHARLEGVERMSGYYAGKLRGNIYGDTKGRFQDGEVIFTSRVSALQHGVPAGCIRTISGTIYQIGSWAPGHEPHDELAVKLVNHFFDCLVVGGAGDYDKPVAVTALSKSNKTIFATLQDGDRLREFKFTAEEIG